MDGGRLKRALRGPGAWALPALALGGVFAGGLILYSTLFLPAHLPPNEQTVVIPRGASLPAIARILADAGLVRRPWHFRLAAVLAGASRRLQAGEYRLSSGLSPWALVKHLVEGKTVEVAVTIPEGLTLRQIAQRLEASGLAQATEIETLGFDKDLIASLGLDAPSLEGYLHPETYRFRKGVSPRTILAIMVRETLALFDDATLARAAELGLSPHEVLTLASIVEKETSVERERPRIAAVFLNRLKQGIPLQADPTLIYALGPRFDGNLTRAHLSLDSPYNTYLHPGLPPTPIANPGWPSIEAVLKPARVKDLYFVAKPDGTHHFSTTLEDHQRAVRLYQRKSR